MGAIGVMVLAMDISMVLAIDLKHGHGHGRLIKTKEKTMGKQYDWRTLFGKFL